MATAAASPRAETIWCRVFVPVHLGHGCLSLRVAPGTVVSALHGVLLEKLLQKRVLSEPISAADDYQLCVRKAGAIEALPVPADTPVESLPAAPGDPQTRLLVLVGRAHAVSSAALGACV
jgi:hypothetical protein